VILAEYGKEKERKTSIFNAKTKIHLSTNLFSLIVPDEYTPKHLEFI